MNFVKDDNEASCWKAAAAATTVAGIDDCNQRRGKRTTSFVSGPSIVYSESEEFCSDDGGTAVGLWRKWIKEKKARGERVSSADDCEKAENPMPSGHNFALDIDGIRQKSVGRTEDYTDVPIDIDIDQIVF